MALRETRRLADMTRARLDRARRLYKRLARPALAFGKDEALLRYVAQAKASGLYSRNTASRDVAWSLVRSVWKHESDKMEQWERHCKFREWFKRRFPRLYANDCEYRRQLAAI